MGRLGSAAQMHYIFPLRIVPWLKAAASEHAMYFKSIAFDGLLASMMMEARDMQSN